MKRKKMICTMLTMSLLLAGCVKDNIQETTAKETITRKTVVAVQSTEQVGNTEIEGIIQAVSDTDITLVVGGGRQKLSGKMKPGGKKTEATDEGTKPDAPQRPDAKPDNMPEEKKLERKTDINQVTVGLSADTEIVDSDGTPVSIDELKKGNMVIAQTDESNTALKITVQLLKEKSLNSQ